ncbi:PKD domain-containing protein [Aliikangiella marina]|uniref:Serine protease n=1 Tax=Aliikangiella marina TaxID=1712262 RepID=A0A545T528_9GAMM|nr:pre-peptidase C-terminal domain-containing protein [Aliikangiella marina]TQV72326.1 PKD domain-containing protein [Aliikangiella marina]
MSKKIILASGLCLGILFSVTSIANSSSSKSSGFTASQTRNLASLDNLQSQKVRTAKPLDFKALITDKSFVSSDKISQYSAINHKKIKIHRPGASFIKIHFSRLYLSEGTYIEVRNSDGTQVHRYGNENPSLYTLRDGDNGVTSFSALTVFGETVIIELIDPNNLAANYHIEVDSIMEGLPENELENAYIESDSLDLVPLSTCGVNERRDVACFEDSHPIEFERSRPVARLLINGSSSCSAWRVGEDNRLFTNNHCISGVAGPSKTEVWFNYQKSGCNSGSTSGRVIVTGDQLLATNKELDFTLFTVKNFEQIQQFGHFGLDVRDPIEQERIFIPQHGRGQPKQLSIVSDQNSDGMCRVDVTLADGSAPNTDMGYMCDTIGGSSGSPVLAASSNNVIALHHFGGCPNQGVLINQIWPQVAEFFNYQIPVGDNSPVVGRPNADFEYSANSLSVSFTDRSSDDGSIVNYLWDFGDGQQSSLRNPTHNFNRSGTYSVSLTVTDNDNLNDTYTVDITVENELDGMLLKGVPVEGVSGATGDEVEFYFDVPENARTASFKILGGSGDADIYVRFGAEPTTSRYDCRPYKSGNSETCSFNPAQAGRYFVMLRAYRSYSNVSLVADYTEGSGDELRFDETGLSGARGSWQHFTLELPEGMTELSAVMSGGSGDADLYVRYGSQPTTSGYQCRPYKNGNNESCKINNPSAGTWFISVRAYSSFSNVDLTGEAL